MNKKKEVIINIINLTIYNIYLVKFVRSSENIKKSSKKNILNQFK